MYVVTVKYGLTKSVQTEIEPGTTIGELIENPDVAGVLGLPENIGAAVNGVTRDLDTSLANGDTVVIEKRAAQKAA